jgi:hypothetical protein
MTGGLMREGPAGGGGDRASSASEVVERWGKEEGEAQITVGASMDLTSTAL